MAQQVKLQADGLRELRRVDERLMSYNVEMTEVTGGTFWKEYTPGQIAGTEGVPPSKGLEDIANAMQVYPPVNLYDEKLRALAKEFGPVWVRVSGTWASKTYYDFDGTTGGKAPEGYQSVLTKEQWIGVLDFVKEIGAKLLISVANCAGLHSADEDETLGAMSNNNSDKQGGGIADLMGEVASLHDLMRGTKEKLDVYSYHYYNGISERLASVMPGAHWYPSKAHTEAYLAVAGSSARANVPGRDQYCPGGQMWVTESGDAGGGGDTWASTYLDVLRTLNELGEFATITDGIIFHNTLASSDYGFLDHRTHDPRPNYFAVLLWNRLMGTTVYESGEPLREGAHVYAHSRRDGKPGVAYLIINNSLTDTTTVELPRDAQRYTLSAPTLRSPVMYLNDRPGAFG